jgi:uncharacterized membrane protein YhaH (DUF805 family)
MHKYLTHFFSTAGRISRNSFFWTSLATATAFTFLYTAIQTIFGYAATLILYPLLVWIFFTLSGKRLHDFGVSRWRLLLLLIPVFGPLWLGFILLMRKGTVGHNQYGDDPLQQNVDYLTVNVHQGGEHA